MGKVVKRAYKFRCYPSHEQAAELSRTFGCVRVVWNKALDARQRRYATESKSTTYVQASAELTGWKRSEDLAFLNEVSSVPLRHQQAAFAAFFAKRAHYPRFKSRKRSRASAEYTRSGFRWREGQLTLAKMTEPLDIRWSRVLPEGAAPSTVTVSRDSAGRWFVSLLVEEKITALPVSANTVGVDLGLNSLAALSTGETITNPRHERSDRRIDFLRKLSTRLIRDNQAVAIEDLTVRNMVANHTLARAISDASWRQFRTMLEYKADWYGREVLVVDRWYPSTRVCSHCGALGEKLLLSVREWTCRRCGVVHDRDVNAARNILAAGLAER
ncbi:RNA-guided endonuclease InsQ/TnpB family protein [Nocardia caishijiensis]|uniref:Transposase n=1 Tax=Nocardia caishijiensis TaxID=184756 RepID=A0ABQ6YUT8_9NOCA|nr:RNA-guided endonuclease TnpB family protein [Nocardia caishijiensis]KAF0849562.1 putative transposase [Nocardia caishijiensis]